MSIPRSTTAGGSAVSLLALLVALGCVGTDLVTVGDAYESRRRGYTIDSPNGPGTAWRRVGMPGAVIAFRRGGPQTVSLQTQCGRPVTTPKMMARHLLIGIEGRTRVEGEEVEIGGMEAWAQSFSPGAVEVEDSVRMKTVTLVVDRCTFDWLLAVKGPFEEAEQAFDLWWSSFELTPSVDAPGEVE